MLLSINAELHKRYTSLANTRKQLGYPVYALEHGFDALEISELKVAASHDLMRHGLEENHWLIWVALAVEAGYDYSGDEYWPALEYKPNQWRSNYDRNKLRDYYRRFTSLYGGPKTVGRWAQQFSNIAGPIANSILPKYLQSLFAQHLYQHRFDLAYKSFDMDSGIGEFLYNSYDGSSSRLKDFLQQTDLTSRIVLALREQDSSGSNDRIVSTVLQRIVNDLEAEHDSRGYFREARTLLADGAIRASSRLRGATALSPTREDKRVRRTEIVELVASRASDGKIQLGVVFPDITALLEQHDRLKIALDQGRYRMIGSDSRLMPANGLITKAAQRIRLDDFTKNEIITFDESLPELKAYLGPIYRLEDRKIWVLRRTTDGFYKQVLAGNVKGGESYLIVSREMFTHEKAIAAHLTLCAVNTIGTFVYSYEAPEHFIETERNALAAVGIGTEISTRIEPVGLNPWTNANAPMWLTTETPTLQIRSDQNIKIYELILDNKIPVRLATNDGSLLVALNELEVGNHSLMVSTVPEPGQPTMPTRTALFEFIIETPKPWPDIVRDKAGFRLLREPSDANLEAILSGQSRIRVIAPAGRQITWSIVTFDPSGKRSIKPERFTTPTGSTPQVIYKTLERLHNHNADSIDSASRVDIVASIDELGQQSIIFPRVVQPLRWVIEPSSRKIRLIDETDHESRVSVVSYSLSNPMRKRLESIENALSGLDLEAPGMLVVATYKGASISLLACTRQMQPIHSFKDLQVLQELDIIRDPIANFLRLITAYNRWRNTRPVGDLPFIRKQKTLNLFEEKIICAACGQNFALELLSGRSDFLLRAQAEVGGSPGFGLRMRTNPWPLAINEAMEQFKNYAAHYGVETDAKWAELAFRFAFELALPKNARVLLGGSVISELLKRRQLLRGAFLAREAARATPEAEAILI